MKKKPRYALSAAERYLRCLMKRFIKERVNLEMVVLKKCRREKCIIKNLLLGSLKFSSELPGS